MEYKNLGRTGVKISTIGLGSDDFGDGTSRQVAEKIITHSVDAGINLIDTGNLYAGGQSEKIIGKTLKLNNIRHKVIISTKVDHAPRKKGVSLDNFVPELPPNVQGNSRLNIIRACELSLKSLKTDYIDLFQVHRYYPEYHIEETLGALTDLVRQGKVRYAGCSTFPPYILMKAIMLSEMKQFVRFAVEESPYNLLDRRIENELVPLALEHGIGIFAWSPLAHGMLVGLYQNEKDYPKSSRAGARGSFYAERITKEGINVGKKFIDFAKIIGLTPAQLSIIWTKNQPAITSVLVGTRNLKHLEELLKISETNLSEEVKIFCNKLVSPGNFVANFHNTSGWIK
tara:strand:- start:1928 stop:2953 length:1026 start_codon:yes stop_codon:yes gene_type:complete